MAEGQRSFDSYLRDASRLQSAMAVNAEDTTFVNNGGRIVYLVDANIVGMFVRPDHHTHYLSVFRRWLPDETLIATATLTAEFIFSGNLPGQKGDPIYLTSMHHEEVISLSEKFEAEFKHQIAALAKDGAAKGSPELFTGVKELAAVLDDQRESKADRAQAFLRRLPPEIARMVQGPWAAAVQLKRLFADQSLLRRIDGASWFNPNEYEPTPRDVVAWRKRLLDHRNRTPQSEPPDGSASGLGFKPASRDRSDNLMRDAECLATLVRLVQEAKSEGSKVRYCFITADATIRQAMEAFVQSPEAGGIPDFTRHVREFAPLLNLSAMSDDRSSSEDRESRREIFQEIHSALVELLVDSSESAQDQTRSLEARDMTSVLSYESVSPRSRKLSRKQVADKIDRLRDLWSLSAAAAAGLTAQYLEKRDEAFFDALGSALKDRDLMHEFLKAISETFEELRIEHAKMTFLGSFEIFRKAAAIRSTLPMAERRPRAPLNLLGVDFSKFIGDEGLYPYFERVARGEVPESPAVRELENEGETGLLHLFSACLFILVDDWQHAHAHSQAAVDAMKVSHANQTLYDEALYCNAVTTRFIMSTHRHYADALNILHDAIRRASDRQDRLREARAYSERAALDLFALYRSQLAQKASSLTAVIEPDDFATTYKHVMEALEVVLEWQDSQEGYHTDDEDFVHSLVLQLRVNRAATWVFRDAIAPDLYLPPVSANRSTDLDDLQVAVKDDALRYGAARLTARIYEAVLLCFESSADEIKAAISNTKSLLRGRLVPTADLHEMDRVEYEVLLDRLEEMRAG